MRDDFDGGHSFRVITPGAPPTAIQSIEDPPGGGDTDLNFDRSAKALGRTAAASGTRASTGSTTRTQRRGSCRRPPSERQVFVSAASAASGWMDWTKPVQVSDGATGTGDAVNVFPWIKAGGAGRADAVWYGSNKSNDPSSQTGEAWNVFMAQVVFPVDRKGAVTGATPSVALVKVSPHPMHYSGICLEGTGCIESQGNRNLADFFSVTIDASGAAEIVYDDTSNGLVQPGFTPTGNQTADHAGAPLVTVARQSSGPGSSASP